MVQSPSNVKHWNSQLTSSVCINLRNTCALVRWNVWSSLKFFSADPFFVTEILCLVLMLLLSICQNEISFTTYSFCLMFCFPQRSKILQRLFTLEILEIKKCLWFCTKISMVFTFTEDEQISSFCNEKLFQIFLWAKIEELKWQSL